MAGTPDTGPAPLRSERVILCEGKDEREILLWLRDQRGLTDQDVDIRCAEGRSSLPGEMKLMRRASGSSGVKLLAVVLDAEEDSAADQALQGKLRTLASQAGWHCLLLLLPGEGATGALETLARQTVSETDTSRGCADAWATCMAATLSGHTQAQQDKAWLHVWLAGHSAIYSRLGVAWQHEAAVRDRLPGFRQRLEGILDQVLAEPLS